MSSSEVTDSVLSGYAVPSWLGNVPSSSWDRTAPRARPDAFVCSVNGFLEADTITSGSSLNISLSLQGILACSCPLASLLSALTCLFLPRQGHPFRAWWLQ